MITCPLCHEQHEVIRGVAVCPRIVGENWFMVTERVVLPGGLVTARQGPLVVKPEDAEQARRFDMTPGLSNI
jgi:hypothetical protein